MPRFHFNIYDGKSLPDDEGQLFPSWEEARLVAVQCAGNIIADDSKRLSLGEDWRMEVTDATGLVLFQLDFSISESAAIRRVWDEGQLDDKDGAVRTGQHPRSLG